MARIRSVKPEFWDSPATGKASLRARLLYIAMWNWADDYGIGDATPIRLLGFAFPNDEMTVADFPTLGEEISDRYEVVFYSFEDRPFYYIPSWEKHQRTEKRAKQRVPFPHDIENVEIAVFSSKVADFPTPSSGISDAGTGEQGKKEEGTGEREQGKTLSLREKDEDDLIALFDEFYDIYDKKVGRKTAIAKYRIALRRPGVTHELIINAARDYIDWKRSEGKHPEYTKAPTAWLNGEHWNDERATSRPAPTRVDQHLALAQRLAEQEQITHSPRAIGQQS